MNLFSFVAEKIQSQTDAVTWRVSKIDKFLIKKGCSMMVRDKSQEGNIKIIPL